MIFCLFFAVLPKFRSNTALFGARSCPLAKQNNVFQKKKETPKSVRNRKLSGKPRPIRKFLAFYTKNITAISLFLPTGGFPTGKQRPIWPLKSFTKHWSICQNTRTKGSLFRLGFSELRPTKSTNFTEKVRKHGSSVWTLLRQKISLFMPRTAIRPIYWPNFWNNWTKPKCCWSRCAFLKTGRSKKSLIFWELPKITPKHGLIGYWIN